MVVLLHVHRLFGAKFWFRGRRRTLTRRLRSTGRGWGSGRSGICPTETPDCHSITVPYGQGLSRKPIGGVEVKIAPDEIQRRERHDGYGAPGNERDVRGGWFHTGDIGTMAPRSAVHFQRKKKTIVPKDSTSFGGRRACGQCAAGREGSAAVARPEAARAGILRWLSIPHGPARLSGWRTTTRGPPAFAVSVAGIELPAQGTRKLSAGDTRVDAGDAPSVGAPARADTVDAMCALHRNPDASWARPWRSWD